MKLDNRAQLVSKLKTRIAEECDKAIAESEEYITTLAKQESLDFARMASVFLAREFYILIRQNFVDSNLVYDAKDGKGEYKVPNKVLEYLLLKKESLALSFMKEFRIRNLYYDPATWKFLVLE